MRRQLLRDSKRSFPGTPGGHRTPINGLYQCSSGTYGGPGIGRGSSLNCYRAIADDLKLWKPEQV